MKKPTYYQEKTVAPERYAPKQYAAYEPTMEKKPTYYKDMSYAPEKVAPKAYAHYEPTHEKEPTYYEEESYAHPRGAAPQWGYGYPFLGGHYGHCLLYTSPSPRD